MEKVILVGGGGHCKVVIDAVFAAKKYNIAGIIDLKNKNGKNILGISVIGSDDYLEACFKKGIKMCFIAAGSTGNPDLRVKLFRKAEKIGFKFPNMIHPDTVISRFARLGEGNYIAPGAVINADATLGNNCIINTGAVIEHDCKIGNFVHVAPHAAVSGGVTIGDYSHIGAGAVILQNLRIGEKVIIGCGSVVLKDMPDNAVAFGNPCKEKEER